MTPERKTRAAQILREYADCLFESNTVRGQWAEGTEETQEEVSELVSLSFELAEESIRENLKLFGHE